MRPQRVPHLFLWLFLLLISFASSQTPELGIRRDVIPGSDHPTGDIYYSFSGVIEFEDHIDPGNSCHLPDEEFVNLCALAYAEMRKLIGRTSRPGVMGALQYGRKIYFASSVKHDWKPEAFVALSGELENEGSVGQYMNTCLLGDNKETGESELEHRRDGKCAEANVLRLVHQNDLPDFGQAVPNRFVVWQAKGNGKSGTVVAPCHKGERENDKQGCWETFAQAFQLNSLPEDTKRTEGNEGKVGIKASTNNRPAFSG